MLDDREERILARIERHLVASDPDLACLFDHHHAAARNRLMPAFLLVVGLTLLILGGIAAAVPIAVAGMTVSVLALFTAYARSGMRPLWPA